MPLAPCNPSVLQKQYFARVPSSPRSIALFPANDILSRQDWLVNTLLKPDYNNLNKWAKLFWKRVHELLEIALSNSNDEEAEIHEDILFACASSVSPDLLMSSQRSYYFGHSNQHCLSLNEHEASISRGTTGLRTWQASVRLSNHLLARPGLVQGHRVLELGAGTGLLSLVATHLGASVTCSDYADQVLDLLRLNAQQNSQALRVTKMDWYELGVLGEENWDIALAADVLYDPEIISQGLVPFLKVLLGRHVPTLFIAATIRQPETYQGFLSDCRGVGIDAQEIEICFDEGNYIEGAFTEENETGAIVKLLQLEMKSQ